MYNAIQTISDRRASGTGPQWLRVGGVFLIPSTFTSFVYSESYVVFTVRFGLVYPERESPTPEHQPVVDFAEVEDETGDQFHLDYKVTQRRTALVVTSPRGVNAGSNGREIINMPESLLLARGGLRYVLKTIADHATRVYDAAVKRAKISDMILRGARTKAPCVPLSSKEMRNRARRGVGKHPHHTNAWGW